MQLLVSVRSAAEAESALAGGADVIDAKEPAAGALGPVAPEVLTAIDRSLPRTVPLSAALGDVAQPDEAARLVAELPIQPREAPVFAKLAMAESSRCDWLEMLSSAGRAGAAHAARPLIIATVYADCCASNDIFRLLETAAEAGTAGVLLDTARKDGHNLLDWLSVETLARWTRAARSVGLLSGLAGSLGLTHFPVVTAARADVIGVRGAACDGGRIGRIDVRRVQELHRAIAEAERRSTCKAPYRSGHQPLHSVT